MTRTVRQLRRRSAQKKPRLRILVVSEGEKTEGIYLSLFVRQLRAANVQIDIMGKECGSDPQTVAEFAKKKFQSDGGYDICFCVIDRDQHPQHRFDAALNLCSLIDSKNQSKDFLCIVSDPCIEYWFLLHFIYTRAPYVSTGSKSRADHVIEALKIHIPNYKKTSNAHLETLMGQIDTALQNADRAFDDVQATGESNPSTSMQALVRRLMKESEL